MTGRAVSGWGIMDGLGVAAGRNARGRRDAQCRADGARPARQSPRHRRLGADAARGQAAPEVRPASRRRRASPRSRDAAAGLRELRRAVPHQGLAVSPGRDLVRRGGGTAAPVPLSGLWSRGSVALADCGRALAHFPSLRQKAEDLLYKRSLRRHVTPGHGTHLSLGQPRHCFDAGQRPLRRPEALKAEHGPGQALDPAVVLLDRVVEPAPPPVPGEAPQLAFLLHLAQRAGIALEAVGDDLARVAGVLPAEGTLEEALCCLLVPLGAEQEVDRLARPVDCAVQVAPLPADPDVSLINVPRPAARTQVAAHSLLELRGEA